MPTITEQSTQAITNLLESDEDQLYAQLGIRSKAVSQDISHAASLSPNISYDIATMGVLDDVKELGQRLYNRWSVEAYKLMCGSDVDDTADRQKLVAAIGLGDVAVGAALSGALIGIGLAPVLAPVVAALVVKHFFRPGLQEFCTVWKNHLPPTTP